MLTTIHLGIVIGTALVVLFADHQGMRWMSGKDGRLPVARALFLHRVVTVGLVLLLITGGLLYARAAPAYLADPRFVLKMSMLFVIIVNTYFIERFSKVASEREFTSLTSSERLPLFISGGVSFVGWVTIIICGLSIA